MNQQIRKRMSTVYKLDRYYFYILGALSFYAGVKVCDFFLYDEVKVLKIREQVEDDYWAVHGEPKHIKPDIVKSYLRPGEMRKSYIKITMGKDTYIPKKK